MFKAPDLHDSASFYDKLMRGSASRGILGKDRRFNVARVTALPSVQRFFIEVVRRLIEPSDRVLDLGCGPGSFTICAAPFCGEIIGTDISMEFVSEAKQSIQQTGLAHATAIHTPGGVLPFEDNWFDVLMMIDVVHHLDHPDSTLDEAFRVIRPGGQVIIYEPNKLNPMIALVHLLDRNEWGLLALGTPWAYRRIFERYLTSVEVDWNGIVIGPESRFWTLCSDLMNSRPLRPTLGWLNPKLIVTGRKRHS